MILFGKKHLHVSEGDQIIDELIQDYELCIRLFKVRSGEPTSMKIEINTNDKVKDRW